MTRAEGSPGMTSVTNVVVFQRTGKLRLLYWQEGRDLWWQHELTNGVSADYSPEEMNAEDPLFILYTSPARPASERRGTTLY